MRLTQKRPTGLTGAAGEYFVAAELSLRGWLATVTIKNAPWTDVLAQIPDRGLAVAIQTKTASGGTSFQLNQKCETPATAQNQWYVFVRLQADETRPSFYIVPHNIVAGATYAEHRWWLRERARDGTAHKDNPRRVVDAKHITGYEDRWDLLARPADKAPLLVGEWYTECVEKFGLPAGHPGWPKT